MLLSEGEKVHIIERRRFENDVRRHFIGQVIQCSEYAMRVRGYTWVFDNNQGQFVRRTKSRERIVPLGDWLIINVLNPAADIELVQYLNDPKRGLLVTDGKQFDLEINEFSTMR